MKQKEKFLLIVGCLFMLAFLFLIVGLKTIDVSPIGPNGTSIGFSGINQSVKNAVGTSSVFYTISECMGYCALAAVFAVCLQIVVQFLKKRSLKEIRSNDFCFAFFCFLTIVYYVFFNKVVINYRPILVDGMLEPGFPSSHTLLAVFGFSSVCFHVSCFCKTKKAGICILTTTAVLIVFAVFARAMSGYHWITDIIGGILLGLGLFAMYVAVVIHFGVKQK